MESCFNSMAKSQALKGSFDFVFNISPKKLSFVEMCGGGGAW